MTKPTESTRHRSGRKVLKTVRLNPELLSQAQRILGTPTATETIDQALDFVVFRHELMRGSKAMLGKPIKEPQSD